jgi:hypothetical protein
MRSVTLLLLAGVLSILIGAGATGLRKYFTPPEELMGGGGNVSGEMLEKIKAAGALARMKNLALIGAVYGGGLCLLAGAAAGIAERGRPLPGAAAGLVLGTVLGGVGGMLDIEVYNHLRAAEQGKYLSTALAHAALWLPIGLAFAATVKLATRRRILGQLLVMAVLCGGIAAAVYPMACAVVFPMTNPEKPLPIGTSAAIAWFVIPSLLLTIGAGRLLAHPPAGAAATAADAQEAS